MSSAAAAAVTSDWETGDVAVPTIVRAAPASGDGDEDGVASTDVDAAATAFRNLRLLTPSNVFTHQQQQQPSPQHAHYDPNATYPQAVSPATATAAVARFGQLDPVLLAGLENARERLSLLKFEDQIVRFIKNPREMQLSFPPLSSYHRLIIHRLAERCCLEHQTADFNAYASGGYDGNSARVVTLFKTAQTIVPGVLLIDLSTDMQPPTVTPASAPKIMMRKRNAPRGPGSHGGRGADGQDAKNQQRSIEDRERAYAEARARIFGEESSAVTTESSTSMSLASTSTTTTTTTASTLNGGIGSKFGGSAQAVGPDGSRGFVRGGRGNAAPVSNQNRQHREPSPPSGPTSRSGHGHGHGNANGTNQSRPSAVTAGRNASQQQQQQQPQNWKESKVLWRNREQELNDPDFTRNHDAYRPSRDQQYGGGGGRFGGQPQPYYYDGPRSYGYQGAAQPAYPGRGRGAPPNEYSRIDPMHRQGPPPPLPPPPSDYYRHHPHQAPPPPPGAFNSSYSPHGRGGGYGGGAPPPPPPPLPPSSHQQARRGSANGSYNDDFPPLGK